MPLANGRLCIKRQKPPKSGTCCVKRAMSSSYLSGRLPYPIQHLLKRKVGEIGFLYAPLVLYPCQTQRRFAIEPAAEAFHHLFFAEKFEKQRIQTIRFGFYADGYTLTDRFAIKHGHQISLDDAENVAVFNPINKTAGGRLKAARFEFGFK